MSLYDELLNRKNSGENFEFDKITTDELNQLFIKESIPDSLIAALFDVPKSKVTYRRKKLGIGIRNASFEAFLNDPKVNKRAKADVFSQKDVNAISKAITHFAFRNGPIEDMHANNQLTQEDMKTLNKFMVNRLAYVFSLIINEKWLEFQALIEITDKFYGHSWDPAEPDDGGMRMFLFEEFKKARKNKKTN